MMPKISIIIPVYNSESYLCECIDSVISQSYTDWELILVNDGSTDASGFICDQYSQRDSRIRVLHKPNSGVSNSRNLGIKEAQAEWIMFMDSDDYIDKETLNISVRNLQPKVDLLVFGIKVVNNDILENPPCLHYIGTNSTLQDQLEEADRIGWLQGPVNKLFKRSLIVDNNLLFDVTMSYGEDTKFSFTYLQICNNIQFIPHFFYNYCFRNSQSLTSKTLSWNYSLKLAKMLRDVRIKVAVKFSMSKSYIDFIQFIYASRMSYALCNMAKSNDLYKKEKIMRCISNLKKDAFMRTYKPGMKRSRNYTFYTKFPLLWYYLMQITK